MIKFNFELPNDQAELLLDTLRHEASEYKRFGIGYTNQSDSEWHLEHAALLNKIADIVAKGSSGLKEFVSQRDSD